MGRGESEGASFSRERDWDATRPDGIVLAEDSPEIVARWGCDPATLGWRLIEIPIAALAQFAPAAGLAYYQHLAEMDSESKDDGENDDEWEDDESFDGQLRYELALAYKQRFLNGEAVAPLVLAWDPELQLLDGFHRLAAAFEAGVEQVQAYALLDED